MHKTTDRKTFLKRAAGKTILYPLDRWDFLMKKEMFIRFRDVNHEASHSYIVRKNK